ncbi:ABC transporter permease [Uliginosibacterium sp. 31-16]|uniref:ABC transporter permease n=1 Tax=Uliginosibacterium sp. 31-16 TaxID=3068315 RepID=UPI00273FB01D|nr:ABC transporter permease [Uliginosibacterium sp. 31-16]MDP5240225.1 ABC transporter permease [Uliginosibacterium sp. 31-16]
MLELILRFALRNPLRHKLRSVLTLTGIVVAILAFGLLGTIVSAWYAGANAASDKRLVTRNSISLTFSMPLAYADRIRAIEGVTDLSWENWFGGVYKEPSNFFPQFAIEPESFFRMVPEFRVKPDEMQAFLRDRRGVIAGRKLANRFGWKLGDVIPIKGTIFAGDYEFVLRGIYDGARASTDEGQFFLRWDYLNERIKQLFPGSENQVGIFLIGIADGRDAAAVSQRVDAHFRNSLAETLTETEKAFQLSFVAMTGTIVKAIQIVSYVIICIIMAVMANTMAMAARERSSEYATLKALGFRPWVVGALVYAESLALALIAGGLGIALTGPAARAVGSKLDNIFPVFGVAPETIRLQWAAALVIGLVAALIPARQAMRVKIIEGLRQAG